MPRANGARVARNLGRFIEFIPGVANRVTMAAHASQRVGSSDQAGGSVAFWMRSNGHSDAGEQDWLVLGNTTDHVLLTQLASASHALQVITRRASVVQLSATCGVPTPGKKMLVHLAWSASVFEVWFDGVLVLSSAVDARPAFPATVAVQWGTFGTFTSFAVNGAVGGEAYLFDRKLSKGEIEQHFFDGEVPSAPVSAWGPTGWPATGTTVTLTGGSGNNGTITSGVLMNEPAEQKPALAAVQRIMPRTFTSLSGYVGWAVPDTAALNPAAFTIEARVHFDNWQIGAAGGYRAIVVKTTNVTWSDGWGLVEIATTNAGQRLLRLWITNYGNGTTFMVSPHAKEVHVLATYDGTTAKMYVDGELAASWNAGALVQVAQPIRIAYGFVGANAYQLEGAIRDVRYYSRALSAVEARSRFQDNQDIESGLIGAWRMDDASANYGSAALATVGASDRVAGRTAAPSGTAPMMVLPGPTARALAVDKTGNMIAASVSGNKVLMGTHASYCVGSRVNGAVAGSVMGWFMIQGTQNAANNFGFVFDLGNGNAYAESVAIRVAAVPCSMGIFIRRGGAYLASGQGAHCFTPGKLTHYAVAWDATSVRLYVDGALVWESLGDYRPDLPAAPTLVFGNNTIGNGHLGNGTSARVGGEAFVFARKLTQGEVRRHFEDGIVPDSPSSGWGRKSWVATSTTVKLSAGTGNDGAVTGYVAEKTSDVAIETPRTQALGAASAFSNAQWTKSNLTFSGAVDGPDGSTLDAENMTEDSALSTKQVYTNITSEKATYAAYVLSVDIAASGRSWVALSTGAGAAFQWFNLATGVIGSRSGTAILDAWIESRGNGYYRCSIVTNQNWFSLFAASADGVVSYLGDGRVALKTANVQVTRLSAASRGQGLALAPAANVAYDVGSPDERAFTQNIVGRPNLYHYASVEDAIVVSGNGWQLPDRSGGGRNWAQGVPTKRAAYSTGGLDGKPYLTFDGVDDHYIPSTSFATDLSVNNRANWLIAAVVHPTSAGGSQSIFDSFDTSSSDRILVTQSGFSVAGQVSWYDGTWNQAGASTTGAQLLVFDLREGKGGVYRNGQQIGSFGSYRKRLMDNTTVGLGIAVDFATGMFVGRLYDIAIFKNQNDGDFQAVHRYFADRFPSLNIARY